MSLDKPIVAALHGAVVGGGLTLALLADVRVAADDSRFRAGYIDAGLGPRTWSQLAAPPCRGSRRRTGPSHRGKTIDAAEAYRLRIADRLVGAGQAWEAALEIAREYAAQPTLAAQLTKRALRTAWITSAEAHMALEWTNQRFLFTTEGSIPASPHSKNAIGVGSTRAISVLAGKPLNDKLQWCAMAKSSRASAQR